MKKKLIIFLLFPIYVFAQPAYLNVTPTQWYDTYLQAYTVNNSQINLQWANTGADTYTLQTSPDNSAWSTIYSGANVTFNHTGLSQGTLYYYQVKGSKTGSSDSNWAQMNLKTLSFNPVFFYDYSGLVTDGDNAYGTTALSIIKVMKSTINTGAQSITYAGANTGVNQKNPVYSYVTAANGSSYNADAPSNFTVTGDFTIIARAYHTQVHSFKKLIYNSANTNYQVSFSNETAAALVINGSVFSMTWPSSLVLNTLYDYVFQRTGTTVRIGLHDRLAGTMSWSSNVTGNSSDFIFNRFFADNTGSNSITDEIARIGMVNSSLSDAQIDEFFSFGTQAAVTIPSVPSTFLPSPGVVYFSPSSGYYNTGNDVLDIGGDSNAITRILTMGDKSFFMATTTKSRPKYAQDVIHQYDHSTGLGSVLTLRNYNTNENVHEGGSMVEVGTRLMNIRPDPFYSTGFANAPSTSSKLRVAVSSPNLNFYSFNDQPVLNGIANISDGLSAYANAIRRGNTIVKLEQEFTTSGQYMTVCISYDLGVSWKVKRRVADSGGTPQWWYPFLLNNGANSTVYIAIQNYNTTANKYQLACVLKSSDTYLATWSNLSGSFSQDVTLNNPISYANAKSNCMIGNDATALAGGSRVLDAHTTTGGDSYYLMSNGSETGFIFLTETGGTVTSHAINTGSTTVETNHFYDGVVWKTATNTYNVCLFELSSGNRLVHKFQTTDGGSTWSDIGRITTDATKTHNSMYITRNIDHINYGILATEKTISSNVGNAFIYSVKDAGVYH